MTVVAIIAEYNPFHSGHLYQIRKIREIFQDSDSDLVIISIMSGSLVQRGELALFSKYDRAKTAVESGIDLILELPSVYSNSPANIFAFSAVNIINKLSGVDYICFGSESGDINILDSAAGKIMSPEFEQKLTETIKANKNKGYAKNIYDLFGKLYGEEKAAVLNGSNNILAIEYLKALKKLKSKIRPLAIKRTGADFKSAGYIREFIANPRPTDTPFTEGGCGFVLKDFIPEEAYKLSLELINSGKFTQTRNLSCAIISHLNRLEVPEIAGIADVSAGDAYKIKRLLGFGNCFDYDTLVKNLAAKHISRSSARRMILNIFFGITKEMRLTPPDFTAVLALNQKGGRFLNKIKKTANIKIITKPSVMINDNNKNIIYEKNLFIDNTFKLALFNKDGETGEIRRKPYRLI